MGAAPPLGFCRPIQLQLPWSDYLMGESFTNLRWMQSRPRLLLLALALIVLAGYGAYRGGRAAWAWRHWRAIGLALEKRDFALARAHLDCCLQIWPTSPEIHLLAARAARRAE